MKRVRNLFIFGAIGLFLPMSFSQAAGVAGERVILSPIPRSCTALPGNFLLTNRVNLEGVAHLDADTRKNLFAFFAEKRIAINEEKTQGMTTIIFRHFSDVTVASDGNDGEKAQAEKPEGYRLRLEGNNDGSGVITIESNDEAGYFYAVQTLKQILAKRDISAMHIEDYPDLPIRGIVEGFYGKPWTHEERLDQLNFYGQHKLNTYIYAPKDDPYHRVKWREPYPPQEMKRMKELIAAARENKVEFVFAISPGIDIAFVGEAGEHDFTVLLNKLTSLYEMGVRSFAIYYDDIEDKSGVEQAKILNRLQKEFVQVKGDVNPLITVPTEYFTLDMADNTGKVKAYTKAFAGTLDKAVSVMYTGPGVVCERISEEDIVQVSKIYGRKMAVWWNYPVNDYLLNKLALGPIYGLTPNMATHSDAFLMNPMEHAALSKITLQTGADYAWNPGCYDPEAAWDNAITMQYGALADAMKVLAEHSSYMDKEWAKVGRPDAPQLRKVMDDFFVKIANKQDVSVEIQSLSQSFTRMENASQRLTENLSSAQILAAKPQIEWLGKLARYDKEALAMIEAKLAGDTNGYNRLRRQTEKNVRDVDVSWARLSEKTAVYFLRKSREIE